MSENVISPDLMRAAGGIRFTAIDLADVDEVQLATGQLVAGMQTLHDFSLVEARTCRSITEVILGEGEHPPDPIITKRPIDNFLRPKGFNGRLLEGYVAFLPFSSERVKELDKRHSQQLENELLTDERPGWRLFFGGLLRKTGSGTAPFMREVLYFQKARVVHCSGISRVVSPAPELAWTPVARSRQSEGAGTASPGNTSGWLRTKHTSSRSYV